MADINRSVSQSVDVSEQINISGGVPRFTSAAVHVEYEETAERRFTSVLICVEYVEPRNVSITNEPVSVGESVAVSLSYATAVTETVHAAESVTVERFVPEYDLSVTEGVDVEEIVSVVREGTTEHSVSVTEDITVTDAGGIVRTDLFVTAVAAHVEYEDEQSLRVTSAQAHVEYELVDDERRVTGVSIMVEAEGWGYETHPIQPFTPAKMREIWVVDAEQKARAIVRNRR